MNRLGKKAGMTDIIKHERAYNVYNDNYKLYDLDNVILMSDIHSEYESLEFALKEAKAKNKILFILGDLFDRGEHPQKVLDLISDNLSYIRLLMGNHDDMLYHSFDIYEDSYMQSNIYNPIGLFNANDKNSNTLYGLLPNSGHFSNTLIYNEIFRNVIKNENKENIDKLKKILKNTQTFIELNRYKGYRVRLSHTGTMLTKFDDFSSASFYWDLEPRKGIINYRQRHNIIDICGHWSTPHLIRYLDELNIKYTQLNESIYVHKWNALYIDNGKSSNIVRNLDSYIDSIIKIKEGAF